MAFPIINTAWEVRVALEDYANPGNFKSSPTISSGDIKTDLDGGGFATITNDPATVDPAASRMVLIELVAAETNGTNVTIQCIDQTSPKEWSDLILVIPTRTS